jgi:secondary thiamine-phosphate synthase enzyme
MRQLTTALSIRTERQGLLEVTDRITKWTEAQAVKAGLLTIFCRHTSASLLIQENAASAVRVDLERYFARIAPEDSSAYTHDDYGGNAKLIFTTSLVVDGRSAGLYLDPYHRRNRPKALKVFSNKYRSVQSNKSLSKTKSGSYV